MEGMEGVRSVVYNHFSTHYQVSKCERLGVENFNFKFISMVL
jgi:hypothetical protein